MKLSHRFVLAGFALTFCTACGDDGRSPESSAPPYPVDLLAPEYGIQVQTVGRIIPPGADEEWCEVVELPGGPGETYFIGRTEIAMAPFSHHLNVSFAPEDSPVLDQVTLGSPIPCTGAHVFGNNLVTFVGALDNYDSSELPPGIGHVLRGGQRLVFDYHALNTSTAPVPAAHRLNLHRVDHIDRRAQLFGFYNYYIAIPPHSRRSFVDECAFNSDVLVWSLARHTHRRGTSFTVRWYGGARDNEHLWTSADWEHDIDFRFDEPVVMPAGTGFSWECAYDNPTDETLIFGVEATDEMCNLFGQLAAAGDVESAPPQSCHRFSP